ncbi:MAG: HPF/RaiA family ribosome-associated protein, partial [Thermodesulfovibrionales bacterium]
MTVPVQITVHNLELTEAIRAEIEKKADKLGQFFEEMQKLRIVVDLPHRHSHEGMRYEVRIDMVVPGNEIVIRRQG